MTNPKCGDCARFQKYHKTITKSGWSNSACMFSNDVPSHIPVEQKTKYIKEYIKQKSNDYICDIFVEDHGN